MNTQAISKNPAFIPILRTPKVFGFAFQGASGVTSSDEEFTPVFYAGLIPSLVASPAARLIRLRRNYPVYPVSYDVVSDFGFKKYSQSMPNISKLKEAINERARGLSAQEI
jgi:hypothetical protein